MFENIVEDESISATKAAPKDDMAQPSFLIAPLFFMVQ